MKVLVIGGTGSISREIVAEIIKQEHEAVVYNRGQRSVDLPSQVRRIVGDRSDYASFETQMTKERFDVVIDMIAYDDKDAASTLRAFRGRTAQVIYTSSIACYKRPFKKFPPISESGNEYVDNPADTYGYKKALLEKYLYSQIPQLNDLGITIVRPALTFGKGANNIGIFRQNYGLIKRMREGKPVILFGDGQTPMNFSFTPDVARGYVALAGNSKTYGEVYHLTNFEYSTWQDLYEAIAKAAGAKPQILHIATDLLLAAAPAMNGHLFNDKKWVNLFDSSKARRDVGYNPQFTLETGFKWLVDWYDSGHEQTVKEDVERFEDQLVALYRKWEKEISGKLA